MPVDYDSSRGRFPRPWSIDPAAYGIYRGARVGGMTAGLKPRYVEGKILGMKGQGRGRWVRVKLDPAYVLRPTTYHAQQAPKTELWLRIGVLKRLDDDTFYTPRND